MLDWPGGGQSLINIGQKVLIPKGTYWDHRPPKKGIFVGGSQQIYIESTNNIPGLKVVETFNIVEEVIWKHPAKK